MVLYVRKAGTWRTGSPWFKRAGAWVAPTKVWSKVAGTWTEVWPLVPTAIPGTSVAQVFRNDRIEADVHWSAPTGGSPVDHYNVNLKVTQGATVVTSTDYTAGSSATALTSTGQGGSNGYQGWAGSTIVATITPYAADNRAGAAASSPVQTVIQLPAPPAPTGFNTSVESGSLRHVWSHVSGNRLTDFLLTVTYGGVAYNYAVAKGTSVSVIKTPWTDEETSWGRAVTTSVVARGPGGISAAATDSASVANKIAVTSYGYEAGSFIIRWNDGAGNTSYNFACQNVDGSTAVASHSIAQGVKAWNVTGSSAFPRDNYQRRVYYQPLNASGIGPLQAFGWCRKAPNPCYIVPTVTDTARNGGWRNEFGAVYQGYTSAGMNYGHCLYNGGFKKQLGSAYLGYDVGVTQAAIMLHRGAGGLSSAVAPHMWLTTSATEAEVNNVLAGGVDLAAIAVGFNNWIAFSSSWCLQLIAEYAGYQGIAFYDSSTAINPSTGASNAYMLLDGDLFTGTPGGFKAMTVRVIHDG